MWTRLLSLLRTVFWVGQSRADVDEELEFHVQARADNLVARAGMGRESALRQARIELGGRAGYQESVRDARGAQFLDEVTQDLRYAVRGIARNPLFAVVVVATLALGIGANTAVFSVLNAVVLRPVAAPEPERIMVFGTAREGLTPAGGSPTRFNAWRRLDDVFENISAYRHTELNLTGLDTPQRVQVAQVSAAYFQLFGIVPAQGRTFTSEEDLPGAGGFAVVSDSFWRRTLSADQSAIGRVMRLGGTPYEIIGVLPPGIRTESRAKVDVWIPFQIDPESSSQGHFFAVAGRIRDGVSSAQIETRLGLASDAFAREYPDQAGKLGGSQFVARPIQEVVAGNVKPTLLLLLGAVTLVLLIACSNIANLLLVRGVVRQREIAVRSSLGAGRRRLARQLLTETSALWLIGTVLGLGLGLLGIRTLLGFNTGNIPRVGAELATIAIDWRVLSFTVVVSAVTGVVFGFFPAWTASRADLTSVVKSSGTGSVNSRERGRSMLVVAQIALALALLVASGLLVRTFISMRSAELGYDQRNLLALQVLLTDSRYQETAAVAALVEASLGQLEAIPGVEGAAAGCCLPGGSVPNAPFEIVGREQVQGDRPRANQPTVSYGYFEVLRLPLLRGRTLEPTDVAGRPQVVVINAEMARRYWPDSDPIGARLGLGPAGRDFFEIVGVVDDIRSRRSDQLGLAIYKPIAQNPDAANRYYVRQPTSWIVRSAQGQDSIREPLKDALQRTSGLPAISVRTMEEVLAESTAREDFVTTLMLVFGGLALTLAAIGVYGLLSYHASQRRTEVGVRLALGASRASVGGTILSQGVRLTALGLVIGLGSAYVLADLLSSYLYGVSPHDPVVFSAAPLILGVVAGVAAAIPALGASGLDPVTALRHD